MKTYPAIAVLFAASCLVSMTSVVLGQGPLTPPGAPAPTMKTLDQIEPRTPISALPFTISQPGSYYLTASLQFSATSGNAITIASGDVTLDLKGHTLSSTAGVTGDAIRINASLRNIAVTNGTIAGNTTVTGDATSAAGLTISLAGFSSGINSVAPEANGNRISNLTVTGCRVIGVDAGTQALVQDVSVSQNGSEGIDAASGIITHCTALLNGSSGGIVVGSGTISNSTSNSNNGPGVSANSGAVINCSATSNRTIGIDASNGSVINCVATSNRTNGIQVDGGTAADSSAISNQGVGIDATNGNISNCIARNNTGGNIIGNCPIPIDTLPFTISQSGSYYLARNLQFTAASGHAITITTSNVTLDLRGHTLSATAAVTGDGIRIDPLGANLLINIAVINGNVDGGGGFANGVHAVFGPQPHGARFTHLSISHCTIGLTASEGAVIEDVTVTRNGTGIDCGACSVSGCVAYLNTGTGIDASVCAVTNCMAWNNGGTGIFAANGSSVTNCVANNNGSDGIFASNGVVAFCVSGNNNQNANGSVDIDATGATRTGNKPTP